MKSITHRLRPLAVAAAALLGAATSQAAIVVSFTPQQQSIGVGGTATVDVSISGLGSEILSGFDMNFVWNSTVLSWTFVTVVPVCDQLGISLCGLDSLPQGNVGANGSSLELDDDLAAIQPDSFLMATIQFEGLIDGATTLTLGADPDFERNFLGYRAESLDVVVEGACIAVGTGSCNTVPEPSSYALALLALAGAFVPPALRRRRAG